MGERISLQIVKGTIMLPSVIECRSLRIQRQIMSFVIDTGSPDSFLSDVDVKKLQIPIKNRSIKGEIDFGGSRFKQISLPKFKIHLLSEDKKQKPLVLPSLSLSALKTTKCSEKKVQIAQTLPSVLGLSFLKEQKLSLHIILTENIAYLQYEG